MTGGQTVSRISLETIPICEKQHGENCQHDVQRSANKQGRKQPYGPVAAIGLRLTRDILMSICVVAVLRKSIIIEQMA